MREKYIEMVEYVQVEFYQHFDDIINPENMLTRIGVEFNLSTYSSLQAKETDSGNKVVHQENQLECKVEKVDFYHNFHFKNA